MGMALLLVACFGEGVSRARKERSQPTPLLVVVDGIAWILERP